MRKHILLHRATWSVHIDFIGYLVKDSRCCDAASTAFLPFPFFCSATPLVVTLCVTLAVSIGEQLSGSQICGNKSCRQSHHDHSYDAALLAERQQQREHQFDEHLCPAVYVGYAPSLLCSRVCAIAGVGATTVR